MVKLFNILKYVFKSINCVCAHSTSLQKLFKRGMLRHETWNYKQKKCRVIEVFQLIQHGSTVRLSDISMKGFLQFPYLENRWTWILTNFPSNCAGFTRSVSSTHSLFCSSQFRKNILTRHLMGSGLKSCWSRRITGS